MSAEPRASPRLRLLPIDDDVASALGVGPDEFLRRYGARLFDVATILKDVIEPTVSLIRREPRDAPFGCYLAEDCAARSIVGTCGFKSGPSAGTVEIAYFTFPPYERRGIATQMACELVEIARRSGAVSIVVAHTLPERNASTAVLTKLGFDQRGVVEDPEDGTIWRWELPVSG